MIALLVALALFVAAPIRPASAAVEGEYLYRVTLVRAAPGHLVDLIDLYKTRQGTYAAGGDQPPFWMRHSQGDHWDLMLLFPMESYAAYYHPERIERRRQGRPVPDAFTFEEQFGRYVAWTEDLFVHGPHIDDVRRAFDGAGFFHVEMFRALPGLHQKLVEEREMENAYLKALGRPENLVFVRDQGASWDVFTVGFYRDIKHFAESADIPLEEEQRAARAAGFTDVFAISPYLRALIARHHDTLAVLVR